MPISAGSQIRNDLVWPYDSKKRAERPFSFAMKKLLRSIILLFVPALFFFASCNQSVPERNLAEIGDTHITVNEFKTAFAFNSYLENTSSVQEAKKRLFSSMVAEKLMAQTLKELPEEAIQLINQYKREALIEAFWKEEILKKISVSPKELQEAYDNSKRKIIVQYLVFNDPQLAIRQKKRLDEGYDFVQLAELNGLTRQTIPVDTLLFDGTLPNIQQAAFRLKKGQVSSLIKEGSRYFILQKIGEWDDLFRSEHDFKASAGKLKKLLLTIKGQQEFTNYFKTHLKNSGYKLSWVAFKHMLRQAEDTILGSETDEEGRSLLFNRYLKEEIDKNSDLTIVRFSNKKTWNAKTLMRRIGVAPYPVSFETRGAFRKSMLLAAKHVLDDEIIVQQAQKLSLQNTAYVQEQIRLWAGHFKALACMRDILRQKKGEAKDKDIIENWLLRQIKKQPITINKTVLDTLEVTPAGVLALKQHFPGRTAVPIVQPFPQMPKWEAKLFK